MKTEFYRVVFNIIPFACQPIVYSAAISEPIELFIKRQSDEYQNMQLIFVCPCSEEDYDYYKKYNPCSGAYAKLIKRDIPEETPDRRCMITKV